MSPEQYSKGLKQLKNDIVNIVSEAPFAQSQAILGLSLRRIFKNGLDSAGNKIGDYDDTKKQTFLTKKNINAFTKKQRKGLNEDEGLTYKELRQKRGLQTDYVDLYFTGDLFGNINTGKTPEGAVIGHTNSKEAEIAGYMEKKYKKNIFSPTEEEIEQAKELMNQYVIDKYVESIKRIFNG